MESSKSRRPDMSPEIRACRSHEEFRACRAIQRAVWNDSELDVPFPLFVVASEIGGQVIGAFEDGRLVGFSFALPALRNGRAYLHSHMTAVRPEAQNRGIGRWLKLAQREDAIERGIDWIEWTFDPLEIRNGYFNLKRLGAIARRYIPNCYGVTTSPLHAGLPTDRLVAEWELRSERVERRLRNGPADSECGARAERVAVPASISEIKRRDPAQARQIQNRVRDEFQQWFGRGYEVVGIEIGADSAEYILEPKD